jgi:hypothetical protein
VISVHSGVLHVSEGAVFTDDQPVNQKYGTFPDLKEKSILRTEQGRAELLLTPGVFLRVGENSAVKMLDNRLSDTRVEVLKGSAVVECDDPMKVNAVTLVYGDYQIHVRKAAVMEFSANPAELKVFHGEAEVELNGVVSVVKAGKLLPFTQALAQEKFDPKTSGDELTRWSQDRSEAVSVANVSAAKSFRDNGGSLMGLGGLGMYSNGMSPYGSWYYNPYYSMYTYMPLNGMFFNPYGYGFFSPFSVYQVYNNPGYFYGGGGGNYGAAAPPTSSTGRAHSISTGLGNARAGQTLGNNGFGRPGGSTQVGSPNSASNSTFGGIVPVSSGLGGGSTMGSVGGAGGTRGGGARGK